MRETGQPGPVSNPASNRPAPAARDALGALGALAERWWQFQRREFPFTAFLAGQPNADPTMFREAPADHERRAAEAASMRQEIAAIDFCALTPAERITHRMLEREIADLVEQHAVLSHLRPWLLPAGPEFTTFFFANSCQAGTAADAHTYVERLATLPAFFADVSACLAEGHARGLRFPRVVLTGALANLRQITTGAGAGGGGALGTEASPWFGPFKRSPAAAQPGVMREAERARSVIEQGIVPAIGRLAERVERELMPHARDSIACTEDVLGAEYYSCWVRHFTTTTLEPRAIHALGLAEVARLDAEMAEVAREAGYAGRLAEYRRFLAEDPQFFATTGEALRERLQVVAKTIDGKIPSFFGRLPRTSYGIESLPAATSARLPPAYAQPNPADGSRSGIFWVSGLPQMVPTTMHVPLALHEGWPGHLMHIALMQEQTALPAFRRANFTKYSACLEGWALYSETLGLDMGLYQTPHQHFGRLDMEMWRACRLAVDTGIHLEGWNRERAIDFMLAHLSLPRVTVEAEVDRYIAMPAQALGYQIGGLKFRELRRRAEQRLGERFDIRAYHDQLMAAGPVTLPVLEEVVDGWLDERVGQAA
ncbi:MAG: DUF885 domain-containing protein [Rubrivivax sp.]|nr:DUF885 domain-containing protein [Rubrivivax sp.]